MKRLVLSMVLASACSAPQTVSNPDDSAKPAGLTARLDDVSHRLLLTGELDAVTSDALSVPRTSQYTLAIRWLETDGAPVARGQKVASFDNSAFVNNLAEQKLAATQSANDLALQIAQNAILTAEKQFEVDKDRIAMEKARGEAAVAPDTLPARVYEQKQLELHRCQVVLTGATNDLEAHRKSSALDVKVKQLALDKSEREIAAAEAAISSLDLVAPRDGIVVIADNPQEGRKLDVGDNVWVGLPIVRLPDLGKMRVKASLSDVDDGRVMVGMRALAYLDAYPELAFPGTITEVAPVAREPSQKSWRRSFQVVMTLERTDPERMLPGMSVRVEVGGKTGGS